MALLVAAHGWAHERGDVDLLALTVDHALRAGSAGEAAEVAAFCSLRGIAHRTLVWSGDKPAAGISAAARQARHKLLALAALEAGTDIVLTGHTFDDQAETVAMRGVRGGGRGEAGIAPATLFDNEVWFVRPLLDTRREALRESLRGQGVGWADDPTNTDMRYERARLRQALSEVERHDAVARAAEQGLLREKLGQCAASILGTYVSCVAPGLFRIEAGFVGAERETAVYVLRILLAVAGGRTHLVEAGRAAELFSRLARAERLRATLSRCVVDKRAGAIFLYREARDLPEIVLGEEAIEWDGRYRIEWKGSGKGGELVVGPSNEVRRDAVPLDPGAPPALVRAAARAEPCVGGVAAAAEDISCTPLAAPWSRHLPSFDLAPARAVSRLIGGREIPPSPLARHNRVT